MIGENYKIGAFLNNLSKKTKNFVVLNSLLRKKLNFEDFIKVYEDRYFDFGNGVANMVSAGSGFLLRNRTPIAFAYTDLLIGHAYDNIRNDFCLTNSNIKIVGFSSSFDNGLKGPAHQYFEEIGVLKNLPNLKIITPICLKNFYEYLEKSLFEFGPVFFCLNDSLLNEFENIENNFLNEKTDNVVLSYGKIFEYAKEAVELLKDDGFSIEIIPFEEVFPFNMTKFQHLLSVKNVVVLEDQNENGLYLELLKNIDFNLFKGKLSFLGIQKFFIDSGKPEELYKKNSLDYLSLYRKVKEILL